MKTEYHHLSGSKGYLFRKIPQNILNDIKPEVDKIQNNFNQAVPANGQLAGQIDREYYTTLPPSSLLYIKESINLLLKHNPEYYHKLQRQFETKKLNLSYKGDAWINFQKKYEYNPLHNHSGAFSYVIWYQIPFYLKDEAKYGAGKHPNLDRSTNGEFQFIFEDGENLIIKALNIDKTMEGHIALFPSSLNHIVYPFYTSDDYRITISGNIFLK